jgi:hypothetical protein
MFTSYGELMSVRDLGGEQYGIHQVSLSQSTGLKDGKGVDIYEGDVVSDGQVTYAVEFKDGEFYLKNLSRGMNLRMHSVSNVLFSPEVIDNIYDNPEILEDYK